MTSRRTFFKGVGASAGLIISGRRARSVLANEEDVEKTDQEKIIGNFVTFYQLVPDKPRERYAAVWDSSEEIIDTSESVLSRVPSIDEIGDLEDIAEPIVGLLRNIIENLETAYDIQIETKYLDKAVRITGYLPLLAQIWNLLQSSLNVLNTANTKQQFIQKVNQTDAGEEAVEQFYIALLLVLTELMFIWTGVGYRTAWKTTRSAANFGLVRLRGKVGLRAYSVLLSVVHWLIRGSFETTASYIVEKTGQIAQEPSVNSVDFSAVSKEEISDVLPKQSSESFFDPGFFEGLFSDNKGESTVESVIDSGTKRFLVEQYDGAGIIESSRENGNGNDWFFW